MPIQPQTFRRHRNRMAAYLSEWIRPFLQGYADWKAPQKPSRPDAWRRIVLLGANHIGDALWLTPSFPTLAQGFPKAEILLVTSPPAAEALAHNPYLTRVISSCEPPPRLIDVSTLRSLEADAVICYDTSAAWRPLLTALQAGIPHRVGYIHKGFSGWVTHPIALKFPQPHPAYFRDLVSQLTGLAGPDSLYPCIYPNASDQLQADEEFARCQSDATSLYIACFPFGRQTGANLPSPFFGQILNQLHRHLPFHVILAGSLTDQRRLERLSAQIEAPCTLMAGTLNLRALSLFLKRCAFVLTTDSGPRHIANAVKVPVVFVPNRLARGVETGVYVPTEFALTRPSETESLSPESASQLTQQILQWIPSRLTPEHAGQIHLGAG
jgi:ADP-heptose:LPS heptosyltransferase